MQYVFDEHKRFPIHSKPLLGALDKPSDEMPKGCSLMCASCQLSKQFSALALENAYIHQLLGQVYQIKKLGTTGRAQAWAILKVMRALDLKGFVVWDFREE